MSSMQSSLNEIPSPNLAEESQFPICHNSHDNRSDPAQINYHLQGNSDATAPVCVCSHHRHHYHRIHQQQHSRRQQPVSQHLNSQEQHRNSRHALQQQHYRHHYHPHPHSHPRSYHHVHSNQSQQQLTGCERNNDTNAEWQISGEAHVSVTVHQPSPQYHQYQALDSPSGEEDEDEELESYCDCDQSGQEQQSDRSSRLISGEEAIPSSSEDNSNINRGNTNSKELRRCIHRNKRNTSAHQQRIISNRSAKMSQKSIMQSRMNEQNFSSRIEVYSDGTDSGVKITDGGTSEEDQSPPLPPRPPPRRRGTQGNNLNAPHPTGVKKYVVWCLICGGFSCLLGIMFLGVYFLLRSYTSTVGYFETVPTFVPATLLILTGLCIMSLARRRNRYSYLIKLSGACGLASALTCALVTVTTTVLHMSRLQALRECEYTQKTRTCTCYSVMIESQVEGVDEGVRFVFDSTADCGVVHGALYSCLRAVFGLSVAGVLIAVFSCMLVYQLLSHERKKMYWEQLELRCRSLYASQQGPPPPPTGPPNGPSIIGTPRGNSCRCCEQCHSHRNIPPSTYPWDPDNRFWGPGQPPGSNFYSPNPAAEDMAGGGTGQDRGIISQRSRISGWSWPRMPWQRADSNRQFRQTPSSPDSQYGFSSNPLPPDPATMAATQATSYSVIGGLPYGVWGPPPPYSDPNSPARRGRYHYMHPNQCQAIMDHQMPPSQQNIPNIECHQHSSSTDSHSIEPTFCSQQNRNVIKRQSVFKSKENYENTPSDSDGSRDRFSNTLPARKTKKRVEGAKTAGTNNNVNTNSNSNNNNNTCNINNSNSTCNQSGNFTNIQNGFTPIHQDHHHHHHQHHHDSEHEHHETGNSSCEQNNSNINHSSENHSCHQGGKKIKVGIENDAFQNIESPQEQNSNQNVRVQPQSGITSATSETTTNLTVPVPSTEPTESEVYFADVSSCCNVSIRNDNFYDDANQKCNIQSNPEETSLNTKFNKEENENCLGQHFNCRRESSIRNNNRMPYIQTSSDDCNNHQQRYQQEQQQQHLNLRLIQKDISCQSMCSMDSGEKTDFTDLSPVTPCTNFNPTQHFQNCGSDVHINNNITSNNNGSTNCNGNSTSSTTNNNNICFDSNSNENVNNNIVNNCNNLSINNMSNDNPCSNSNNISNINNNINNNNNNNIHDKIETQNSNFVASLPFASNEQSQEAHRRSTKNIQDMFLAPDAQYETIKEDDGNNSDSAPVTLNYEHHRQHHQDFINTNNKQSSQFPIRPKSPRTETTSSTPTKRQNLGANITSIIQNLGGTEVSLLYPENKRECEVKQQQQQQNQQLRQQQILSVSMSAENHWSDPNDRRL